MKRIKRKVSFVDAMNTKFNVKLEITTRNGYYEFTCSGDGANRGGQIQDHISPDGQNQELLLEFWEKYHLNGMNPGTEKQMNLVKEIEGDYNAKKEYLAALKSDGTPFTVLEKNKIDNEIRELSSKVEILNSKTENLNSFVQEFKKAKNDWNITDNHSVIKTIIEAKQDYKYRCIYKHETSKMGFPRSRFYKDSRNSKLPPIIEKLILEYKEEREELVKQLNEIKLKSALYDIDPNTNQVVQYGCTWVKSQLPENFDELINELCDDIIEEEKEKKLSKTKIVDPVKISEEEYVEIEEIYNGYDDAVLALAYHLDLSVEDLDDIEKEQYGWGDCLYNAQGNEYYIGTKDDMTEAAKEYIKESLWCFRSEFLAEQTDMPVEVFASLSEQCENGNEAILKIVEKTCGLDEFTNAAIEADSIGHMLNGYDGTDSTFEFDNETYIFCRT